MVKSVVQMVNVIPHRPIQLLKHVHVRLVMFSNVLMVKFNVQLPILGLCVAHQLRNVQLMLFVQLLHHSVVNPINVLHLPKLVLSWMRLKSQIRVSHVVWVLGLLQQHCAVLHRLARQLRQFSV
jgi:hypothetical protein